MYCLTSGPEHLWGLINAFKKKSASFWQQINRFLVFLEPNGGLRLYLVRSMTGIDILIEKLDGFIRKYYKNRLLKGLIYSSTLLCSFFLFAILHTFFAAKFYDGSIVIG